MMEERAQRIVDAAIELADEGGFQNVRLREVAERSGVAFGTLYARFNSKEDILIAALEQEISKFRNLMADVPVPGDSTRERVRYFFSALTDVLLSRTGFAKAVLRAVASGVPGVADKVISYQTTMNCLIVGAIKGIAVKYVEETDHNADIFFTARMMQSLWFAELIGWISEVVTREEVIQRTLRGCNLLLSGLEATEGNTSISPEMLAPVSNTEG